MNDVQYYHYHINEKSNIAETANVVLKFQNAKQVYNTVELLQQRLGSEVVIFEMMSTLVLMVVFA